MKKIALLGFVLTIFLIAGLLGCQKSEMRPDKQRDLSVQISDQQLSEVKKFFASLMTIRDEYSNLLATAKFPTEEKKNQARLWFKRKELSFELLQMAMHDVDKTRHLNAVESLLYQSEYFVEVPTYVFRDFSLNPQVPPTEYASLNRIESLQDDYLTLSVDLAKRINAELANPNTAATNTPKIASTRWKRRSRRRFVMDTWSFNR